MFSRPAFVAVLSAAVLAVGTLPACSDSTAEPTSIAGSYQATTLQVTPDSEPVIDVLAKGGTLSLTIASNNTTTGALTIPGSLTEDGRPIVEDLAGTAVRSGNTVRFQQSGDTFVRDLTFTVSGGRLQTTQTLSGATYSITLTRQ